ncbi:radical SAM/SPASM domain-containing protein [Aliarcobacter butzleri]|uniref:radical SAM/SPASM domain-containing protein n=1 Tax=Aliarcobacter butzleri TaxID=28197 RepID=UPI003B20FCD0
MKIDEYKLYRQKWELATKMELLTEVPLHLDIELTNKCNLDCKMCWQNEHMTYPKGNMDVSLFKKIIDEAVFSGVKAIKLQSRGESTLHPNIIECISYAKNKGIIDIQLTTNATIFSNKINENLLISGLDLLIISIDSDHIESYNRIYKNKNYETVAANILDILQIRKNKNLKYPKIRIQVASGTEKLNPIVEKYIEDFRKYADTLNISPYFLLQDNNPKIENIKTTPCPYPWQRMVINYDGKVTVCCRDYNCTLIMGDITKQTIKDIWNSDKYDNFRNIHKEGKRNMINFCRICNG